MGNSPSGGCDASSTTCLGSQGGCVVSHDGNGFSISGTKDGFVVSGGPYGTVDTGSKSVDSHAYLNVLSANKNAPVTEHVHTADLMVSSACDTIRGDSSCTEMRVNAGHFNSHSHNPTPCRDISVNPFYGGESHTR